MNFFELNSVTPNVKRSVRSDKRTVSPGDVVSLDKYSGVKKTG